jgi:hypothetical protein
MQFRWLAVRRSRCDRWFPLIGGFRSIGGFLFDEWFPLDSWFLLDPELIVLYSLC